MPRLSFKPDASFFRKIVIGAVGTRAVIADLAPHGHRFIELERGSTDTKLWKDVKRKRVRIPDLLCLNCGTRIECRAKTDLELAMSHSPTDAERAWDFGMVDSDWIAFPVCKFGGRSRPDRRGFEGRHLLLAAEKLGQVASQRNHQLLYGGRFSFGTPRQEPNQRRGGRIGKRHRLGRDVLDPRWRGRQGGRGRRGWQSNRKTGFRWEPLHLENQRAKSDCRRRGTTCRMQPSPGVSRSSSANLGASVLGFVAARISFPGFSIRANAPCDSPASNLPVCWKTPTSAIRPLPSRTTARRTFMFYTRQSWHLHRSPDAETQFFTIASNY